MSQPELLMLDEPSLGLAPLIVQNVFKLIRELVGQGKTILLVEQDVFHSLSMANRAYVVENGRIVLSGSGEELLHNEYTRSAYLGL